MRVAGLISGTSIDGIDTAIVDIDEHVTLLAFETIPYAPELKPAILAVSNAPTHTASIARLNYLLGELFAEAVIETCARHNVPLGSIQLIGSHGQTIFHEGAPAQLFGRSVASTLQIGEAAVIAARTHVTTVSDFRSSDMAAGGHGAPLVPFLDFKLFRSETVGRISLNIGGIANITVIPAAATPEQVLAFDTGPGNMIMDALCPPYDHNGERARAGTVNQPLLEELLRHPYYQQPPPKSAGREQYGREFLECGIDLTTATELTARTIAAAIHRYSGIDEVIVSGGGAHNRFLMERLQSQISPKLMPAAAYGVHADAKEAMLFAVLAYETFHRRPGNLPSATGARYPAILGKISYP